MGIVPENEYLLGLEGAGIVRRVGKGATRDFKVGDRVAVLRNGTFANRIQVPKERTHIIPVSLSFEARIPVFLEVFIIIVADFGTRTLLQSHSYI